MRSLSFIVAAHTGMDAIEVVRPPGRRYTTGQKLQEARRNDCAVSGVAFVRRGPRWLLRVTRERVDNIVEQGSSVGRPPRTKARHTMIKSSRLRHKIAPGVLFSCQIGSV